MMKKYNTRTKREIITLITITIGVIIGAIVGVYITGLMIEKDAAEFESLLQQTEQTFEIQKLSEYKGELKAVANLYLSDSITYEAAKAVTQEIVNAIEVEYTEFANQVEESVMQNMKEYPEVDDAPLAWSKAAIDQIDNLIQEIKFG